ncbi:hypothetical protein C8R46DRAFT_434705 [Mycena filopes]|nr:hypothetical protein C8R46DRAFT_434705 [Mycena filopes]
MSKPQYRLLSTNTVPERSRRVIAEIIEQFKDRYELTHVGNSDSESRLNATKTRRTDAFQASKMCERLLSANGRMLSLSFPGPVAEVILTPLQFISSGWTAEQEEEISRIAKEVIPNIKIFSPPRGLHAAEGVNAVQKYIEENLTRVLDS